MKKYILIFIILFTTFQSYALMTHSGSVSLIRDVVIEEGQIVFQMVEDAGFGFTMIAVTVKPQYNTDVVAYIKSLQSRTERYSAVHLDMVNLCKVEFDNINIARELYRRGWINIFRVETDNEETRAVFNEYYNSITR